MHKAYFNLPEHLHAWQVGVLKVLEENIVFAVMPTGSGKSLSFALMPLLPDTSWCDVRVGMTLYNG